MSRITLIIVLCLSVRAKAQTHQSFDTIKAPIDLENLNVRPLYSDSLVSSFVVFIKKEIKLHKHATHSEHVTILEGTGEMILGDKKISVKAGDIIFIPKNTAHSLKTTSKTPVKVFSVQAPFFDGRDRIMIE